MHLLYPIQVHESHCSIHQFWAILIYFPSMVDNSILCIKICPNLTPCHSGVIILQNYKWAFKNAKLQTVGIDFHPILSCAQVCPFHNANAKIPIFAGFRQWMEPALQGFSPPITLWSGRCSTDIDPAMQPKPTLIVPSLLGGYQMFEFEPSTHR